MLSHVKLNMFPLVDGIVHVVGFQSSSFPVQTKTVICAGQFVHRHTRTDDSSKTSDSFGAVWKLYFFVGHQITENFIKHFTKI